VKADAKSKPTRLQFDCMAKIEQAGGRCFVVYDEATLLLRGTTFKGSTDAGA